MTCGCEWPYLAIGTCLQASRVLANLAPVALIALHEHSAEHDIRAMVCKSGHSA